MAQFDVHRNPGSTRESIPFVVVVQSRVFDDYRRRVVLPLVKKSLFGKVQHVRFNPSFVVQRTSVVLHPLEIVSVPSERLGPPVASLAAEGMKIIDALDALFTRVYD
jgi:toxin CcdB